MEIRLSDADMLYSLTLDIGMYTYLQQLLLIDKTTQMLCEKEFKYIYKYAQSYLMDKQSEAVLELQQLLEKIL